MYKESNVERRNEIMAMVGELVFEKAKLESRVLDINKTLSGLYNQVQELDTCKKEVKGLEASHGN